jgi:hypothetical protein
MCEHGTHVEVDGLLAFNEAWHRRVWKIDACIASIVRALNLSGSPTIGSCCGHGKRRGEILVSDRSDK